jgi:hypothetical protein
MADTDKMAAQLAQLLTTSDRQELEEIVARWKETAATPAQRAAMEKMAAQVIALRAALEQAPVPPKPEELELALRMMLKLADGR